MTHLDPVSGVPLPRRKVSTLRRSRSPPTPRHVDKQRAISIARQLKLTNIGNVTLRATAKQNYDDDYDVAMQASSRFRNSRRLLLDKQKGTATARSIKDSAVGRCILQCNEYASRRLLVEQDKIDHDMERRKKLLTQKMKEYNRIRCVASENTKHVKPSTDRILPHRADMNSGGGNRTTLFYRKKPPASPNYMRPLICDKSRSNETAVAEAERFLSSPFIRSVLEEEMEKLLAAQECDADERNLSNHGHGGGGGRGGVSTNDVNKSTEKLQSGDVMTSSGTDRSSEIIYTGRDSQTKSTSSTSRGRISYPYVQLIQRCLLPFMEKDAELLKQIGSHSNDQWHGQAARTKDSRVKGREESVILEGENSNNDTQRIAQEYNNSKQHFLKTPSGAGNSRKDTRRRIRRQAAAANPAGNDRRSVADAVDVDRRPVYYNDERFTNLTSSLIPGSSRARNLYDEAGGDGRLSTSSGFGKTTWKETGLGRYQLNLARFEKMIEDQRISRR